ncbi:MULTISPECIES: type I pullulanase [Paenibacillus]|uniref:type I pullulanase n=1 Tax=Paenibacillus TaxID=44249 RepID=UPI0022B8B332|nr:type I pullulanase [Paenibacillus caseinilyticus]MCZ8519766.1 type I pullulanase [Paenibacillus caseinilyticus]
MSIQHELDFTIHYGDPEVTGRLVVGTKAFDEAFFYDGDDLGLTYTPGRSFFRLWAPTAGEAVVALYRTWDEEAADLELPMTRAERGTWTLELEGDFDSWFYTYRVKIGDGWNEAADPYAKAVGVNGKRGAILDLRKTDPHVWTEAKPPLRAAVDAVIYEVHVRDFSIHPESGMEHKGKFLAFCEPGSQGPDGIVTGIDHLADLGVTHVQLLPVNDYFYGSVDETRPGEQYNWGYDPQNYNVPEGSYAGDPYRPASRIRELKQLVQALHDRGIRVIQDVVYNHLYDGYRANLAQLVPGYYFRYREDGTLSNGSHCGNETASERPMMRKFIVDSVVYWAREFHMDGFRFDLMGLHDVGLMQEIRRRLDEIDPSILVIGEGWNMDSALAPEERANQEHAGRMPRIGQFNDRLRNAIKGDTFNKTSRGFVNGGGYLEHEIKTGVCGSIPYNEYTRGFALEPEQTVNYAECHDNFTLWDKLSGVSGGEEENVLRAMHRLASAVVLTSQGIPLLHAGQEFMRTKQGVENSYKSPDEINRLDWRRCAERKHDVWFMKELIALRKEHPAFRLTTAEEIRSHLCFEDAPGGCVAYTLRGHAGGDAAEHLYVLYHANRGTDELPLPPLGKWEIRFGSEHVRRLDDSRLQAEGIGMVVLQVAGRP